MLQPLLEGCSTIALSSVFSMELHASFYFFSPMNITVLPTRLAMRQPSAVRT